MPRRKRKNFNVKEKERTSMLRRKRTWIGEKKKVQQKGKRKCV
jgi:hypothetical protein